MDNPQKISRILGRKGQFMNMAISAIIAMVVIGIVMTVGGIVTTQLEESNCDGTYNQTNFECNNGTGGVSRGGLAFNVSQAATDGIGGYGQLFPTVGIVIIATIVLMLVVGAFGVVGGVKIR